MITKTRKITVAEFEAMAADPGHRYELVDGELVDMDGKPAHGKVTGQINRLVGNHIYPAGLPLEVGANTGFQLSPDTLRFPDVYVASLERMAQYDENEPGFPQFAPDVAIEVVSGSNTPAALARKTVEYFANGARAVWIADPGPRTVSIRRPGQPERVFGVGDILTGDPEIPGFAGPVADIFAVLDRRAAAAATTSGEDGRL